MTAASAVHDPAVAAELVAEAVRVLNHLTLVPPAAGTPGWRDVTDLCRVLTDVRIATQRLPQAIGQIARHLGGPIGVGCRCDADTDDTREALVASAIVALNTARVALQGAGCDLGVAQGALAHLAPRDATLAGESMVGLYGDGREEV